MSCMQIELSREPFNVFNWAGDPRCALQHLLSTKRALRRDRNAVLVISCLQNRHQRHAAILVLYNPSDKTRFFRVRMEPSSITASIGKKLIGTDGTFVLP